MISAENVLKRLNVVAETQASTLAKDSASVIVALRDEVGKFYDQILPCDVKLPPATIIKSGVAFGTLLLALEVRRKNPQWVMEFKSDDNLKGKSVKPIEQSGAIEFLESVKPDGPEVEDEAVQDLVNKIDELTWGFNHTQLNRALRAGGYAEIDIKDICDRYQAICLMAKELEIENK